MKLDLRRPTLVLAGAWNPAIFTPAWIGRHVFGIPAGAEFTVNVAQMVDSGEPKLVIYINNGGFSVAQNRLELFAVDASEAAFDVIERAAAKIIELLPHTPISAYGINFRLIKESASPDLVNKIRSYDALEERFDVERETISSRINFDAKVQMNVLRQRQAATLTFDFNFHRSGVEVNTFSASISGEIQARLAQALSIMEDFYGLASYQVLMHEFESSQGARE